MNDNRKEVQKWAIFSTVNWWESVKLDGIGWVNWWMSCNTKYVRMMINVDGLGDGGRGEFSIRKRIEKNGNNLVVQS